MLAQKCRGSLQGGVAFIEQRRDSLEDMVHVGGDLKDGRHVAGGSAARQPDRVVKGLGMTVGYKGDGRDGPEPSKGERGKGDWDDED